MKRSKLGGSRLCVPRVAEAMQKNHLRNKTQKRGTKRVTVSRRQLVELASFNAQQRVFVCVFFPPPPSPTAQRGQGGLTAAVALRAAGTMAGKGADMLLPHIQRRGSRWVEVSDLAWG